ncbi:hypothetical protein DM806_12425 [Sphingobium lactosutens]|uniref:anti-sigma factor n=1 Tax=Sphingobium lactosutens TaxID=522773 RepID=UPI0015BC9396|nr:anti-sigma factor [Sphingobium lactosutens]NWK96451.1 hypothetical protein [Sphingobium lactosutens]
MTDPLTPEEERDALAAELALGVLAGAERTAALRLRLSDPAFARLVQDWETRLAPLHGAWYDVAPHDAVWDAVAARIADPTVRLRARLSRWRAGALMSGAVATVLAIMLVMRQPVLESVPAPTAVAQMAGKADGPVVVARYDPQAADIRLRIVAAVPATRLVPELWVIPDGGAPVSLGLIPREGQALVPLSAEQRRLLIEGATLAITMEPQHGAPHPAPSSAPIASGKILLL